MFTYYYSRVVRHHDKCCNAHKYLCLVMNLSTTKCILRGPIESSLMSKFQTHLKPMKMIIDNESPTHATHFSMKDVQDKSETHFSVCIVSESFRNLSQIERHRMVYRLIGDEFRAGLHAVRLQTLTPEEQK